MPRRIAKQLSYGTFFFATLLVIIGGLYLWLKPEPSCFDGKQNQDEEGIDCGGVCGRACLPLTLKPIAVEQTRILFPSEKSISLLSRIQNANVSHGARRFTYEFRLYGKGGALITAIPGASYLYPGEVKYLAVLNLSVAHISNVERAELLVFNPVWEAANSWRKPQLTIQSSQATSTSRAIEVRGRLVNRDTVTLSDVRVLALFYGELGQVAGVSQTELDDVRPGANISFTVVHPLLPQIDVGRTQLFVTAPRP